MVTVSSVGYPGVGLAFESKDCNAFNRTATTLALGEVVAFDLFDTDAATSTTLVLGSSASIFSNLVLPNTLGIGQLSGGTTAERQHFFGVVIDLLEGAGADDALVRVRVEGLCKVKVSAAVEIGDRLQPANGVKTLDDGIVTGVKYIALAREAAGGAATIECLFDGINGIGSPVYAS